MSEEPIAGLVPVDVPNPQYRPNQLFMAFETYYSPRVALLKERYGLERVVAGETDEWRRIRLLRHWIHAHIRIENKHPTRTRADAFAILDAALAGGVFECTHFSIVQHAVLNSFGYVSRRLGAGPGEIDNGGHHGVNEVWVNSLCKWVLVDAKYDLHFEKDGVPLSAHDIRAEVWRDEAKSVVLRYGMEGAAASDDPAFRDERPSPFTYRWVNVETSTNRFTAHPVRLPSSVVTLDDEYSRTHTWYRDGVPAPIFNSPYSHKTPELDWIEWTPNVIDSSVRVDRGEVCICLTSFTPNLRTYQIATGDGGWADCEDEVTVVPSGETTIYEFRAMNLFGVAGPPHRVRIDRVS